jgi:hypothetical protein
LVLATVRLFLAIGGAESGVRLSAAVLIPGTGDRGRMISPRSRAYMEGNNTVAVHVLSRQICVKCWTGSGAAVRSTVIVNMTT